MSVTQVDVRDIHVGDTNECEGRCMVSKSTGVPDMNVLQVHMREGARARGR